MEAGLTVNQVSKDSEGSDPSTGTELSPLSNTLVRCIRLKPGRVRFEPGGAHNKTSKVAA